MDMPNNIPFCQSTELPHEGTAWSWDARKQKLRELNHIMLLIQLCEAERISRSPGPLGLGALPRFGDIDVYLLLYLPEDGEGQ